MNRGGDPRRRDGTRSTPDAATQKQVGHDSDKVAQHRIRTGLSREIF